MFPSLSTLPHYLTPSRTPDVRSRRLSVELRNTLSTPLESYLYYRQAKDSRTGTSYMTKVPLSSLAPPTVQPGQTGGEFNATTVFKCVPLPTLFRPQTQRGMRQVSLHSDRYNPSSPAYFQSHNTISDSSTDLQKLTQRQHQHLKHCYEKLDQARIKMTLCNTPHRLDYSYYMSGRSASLHRRGMLSQNDLLQFKIKAPTENIGLYYGNVNGLRHQRPHSQAIKQFHNSIQLQTTEEELLHEFDYCRSSRTTTPASPFSSSNRGCNSEIGGKAAVFLTESELLEEQDEYRHENESRT